MKYNTIKSYIFLAVALLVTSCSDETVSESNRMVSITVSMPQENYSTRVGLTPVEGEKTLVASFHLDDEFSVYVRQGDVIQEVEASFAADYVEHKEGTLKFALPAFVKENEEYTIYGICGASSRIKNGRLVVDDNSKIKPINEFRAPIWFKYTGKKVPSILPCEYIGTYIVLHVTNQSKAENLFQIFGLISGALYDDLYWDENTNTFSEDFGVSPSSKSVPLKPGEEGVFIYNGIPNGKSMETLNVSMHIGPEITWGMDIEKPKTPKTVGKTLEEGRAYHVYLTWDGEELKFTDGVEENLPEAEVETITVNGYSFDMIKVEGGSFMMGGTNYGFEEDRKTHKVTLSTYYMSKYEVTNDLFNAVMGKSFYYRSGKSPAIATWAEALAFIVKLNLLTGRNFSLPTEAEWEYAARGGKFSRGYKYSGSDNLEEVAATKELHVAGTLKPNELGIYDMTGNLAEWCYDHPTPYSQEPQTNPLGGETGEVRVVRGGGQSNNFTEDLEYENTYRTGSYQDVQDYTHGIRLVLSPTNKPDMNVIEKLISDMVYVEGGTYMMGATNEQLSEAKDDEKPAHQVTVSSFYMCKYEMTELLEYIVTGWHRNGSLLRPGYIAPYVNHVESESDAVKVINKLNNLTGYKFRLPTEAEWEWAARGGKYSKGYKYAGSNTLDDVAWTPTNIESYNIVMMGGLKQPNELGLYDMSGNRSELCQDYYNPNFYSMSPSNNPVCPKADGVKIDNFERFVCRGGSSLSEEYYPHDYRVSARSHCRYWDGGVRLVLDNH